MNPEEYRKIVKEENALLREQIGAQLTKIETSIQNYGTRLQSLEEHAYETDKRLQDIESRGETVSARDFDKLKKQVESIENHSRKLNLRFLGLKSGLEAGNPTDFTTNLLYELFGRELLGPPPLLSIAHRTGPTPATGSRCMIARLLNMQVKRTILRLASERGKDLKYQGHRLSIYPPSRDPGPTSCL